MFNKYPEKSWSISRMKLLYDCERAYYYNYDEAHNGWCCNVEEKRKLAYRLKKLVNIHVTKGSILHNEFKLIIEEMNKGEIDRAIVAKDINKNVILKLRNSIKVSIYNFKCGLFKYNPKYIMLEEYFYNKKITDEEAEKIKHEVKVCVDNFLKSKTVGLLHRSSNIKIIEVDEVGFDNCLYLNKVKLYFKVDLIYRDEYGRYWVVDWKTGRYSDVDNKQLLMYAYYVSIKYKIDMSKISGRIEYLLTGQVYEINFKRDDLREAVKRINSDIAVIDSFLSDEKNNKPLEKEHFFKNINKEKCFLCKFKKICVE